MVWSSLRATRAHRDIQEWMIDDTHKHLEDWALLTNTYLPKQIEGL